MSFRLKNVGTTNQRLMDKMLHHLMDRSIEVYVDDMVVMSDFVEPVKNLEEVFLTMQKYNMRLNHENCVFGVTSGKFLRLMFTHRDIEVNLNKCHKLLEMRNPTNVKVV